MISRRYIAAALLLATSACQQQKFDRSGDDWPYYLGNPEQTHYSTLDQITPANVHQLQIAWTYDSGKAIDGPYAKADAEGNPLVVGERMWVISPTGRLICLNAETGTERWAFDPAPENGGKAARLRGVSYWKDGTRERILFTSGSDLLSVDAATGKPDSGFGAGGRVDLRQGFDDRPPETVTIANVTPGAIYQDLIILGSTGMAPGDIRAFDVRTGRLRWTFHTIPPAGEPGSETWPKDARKTINGANAWAGMTLDVDRGLVFIPTASPGMAINDFVGADRPGSNRFANSIIALDAATGKLRWDFQTVHHDLWDRDLPTPPTLVTVKRDNRAIPALVQTTKSGLVFILNRETGAPLFPVVEQAVPASDMPGEQAWPTQPVPTWPTPFARQRLTADLLTTRTPSAHAAVAAEFSQKRSRGPFDPPSLQGTILLPGMDGGAEWGGQAYDPETGLLYVNSNEMAWTLKLNPYTPPPPTAGSAQLTYSANCAACHGQDRKGQPPTIPGLLQVKLSHEAVVRQIAKGSGRMPGFGATLSKEEIGGLAEWLITGKQTVAPVGDRNPLAVFAKPGARYIFDGYKRFLDPDGYPAIKPPWGTLNALDVSTGKWVWRIPFGEYPELVAQGLRNTGSENYGGAVVTKGGLLFIGATSFDRKFHAYDKRTGKLLWEKVLPEAANATPATYTVNGRQFVVVQAGGGKDFNGPNGGKIFAFALPRR
ncbi:MAG: pyrroloquinoline quinone-dependent dehydrogenase [Novosphingobium sp.]